MIQPKFNDFRNQNVIRSLQKQIDQGLNLTRIYFLSLQGQIIVEILVVNQANF